MRILMINSVCGIRSTGRICTDLAQKMEQEGHEVKIAYGRVETVPPQFEKYAVRIGNEWDLKCHALRTRILDQHGFGSKDATQAFLQWADEYDPQVLWLHNIHGYYINVEMLFAWIKTRPHMQVKWTLHDCWAFTGHCSHFLAADCQKWKTQCGHCPQSREYPKSWGWDASAKNYRRKKAAFTGVANMMLITPSKWLAEQVKQSFLRSYPVEVEYNSIDTSVFHPCESNFREEYGLQNKKIVLGVASTWDDRKGLPDFLLLAKHLNSDEAIVLVGLTKAQQEQCPPQVVGIQRTDSPQQLAAIYAAADVFFNPTYQDTYPTVNLEAEACGTCVVSYDAGGAPETLHLPESTTVPAGDLQRAEQEIRRRLFEC